MKSKHPVFVSQRYIDDLSPEEQEELYDSLRDLVDHYGRAHVEAALVNVLANP